MILLDGKKTSANLKVEIAESVKKLKKQGKSFVHEQGKRTTVIANRGPRLQVKINGNPKGSVSDKYKKQD